MGPRKKFIWDDKLRSAPSRRGSCSNRARSSTKLLLDQQVASCNINISEVSPNFHTSKADLAIYRLLSPLSSLSYCWSVHKMQDKLVLAWLGLWMTEYKWCEPQYHWSERMPTRSTSDHATATVFVSIGTCCASWCGWSWAATSGRPRTLSRLRTTSKPSWRRRSNHSGPKAGCRPGVSLKACVIRAENL